MHVLPQAGPQRPDTGPFPVTGRPTLLPPRLREGDVVAVATPSAPVVTPRRLDRGVAALRALGYEVRLGPLAARGAHDSTPAQRADELNSFFRDPGVRCVVASLGGLTSNAVLDALDYDALRADPKIITGYSDITTVLLAVLRRTGLVTFHGPTLLPELAEYPRVLPYTRDGFLRAVARPEPLGRLSPPDERTEELLYWDEADDRPRHTLPADGWRWLHPGSGTGPLVGGNLETIGLLAGTPYFPDFSGAVVVLETTATDVRHVERALTHLRMLGVFDTMAALLLGRSFRGPEGFEATLRRTVRVLTAPYGVPVVAGMDIGHSDPMLTLPLGVRARVDSATETVEVLDAAVR
ncbi:S66 peptidase family protein [Streptomyces shenzhenensis]|uniref:S66 peptidase family protein n=1 Tax=Streptomyces shenzhenensis TaxID=943815 RepID=UPI0015F069A1|nr:S66 peptidase family protein [Streptomyces shenzhenensis]